MKIEIRLEKFAKECINKEPSQFKELFEDETMVIKERLERVGSKKGLTAKNAELIIKEKATLHKQLKLFKQTYKTIRKDYKNWR